MSAMLILLILTLIASSAACVLVFITGRRSAAGNEAERLAAIETALGKLPDVIRDEARKDREELRNTLITSDNALAVTLRDFAQAQTQQIADMRREAQEARTAAEEAQKRQFETFADSVRLRLGETNTAMKDLAERLETAQAALKKEQKEGLEGVQAKINELIEANQKKQDEIREALTASLKELREENEKKLEEMRKTVDEKLHETLEKRLGESFKLVSDRLEEVHKGLGEMKTLATGVGDLKRVLTNVKSRGTWGEVQLGMLLEDMLTPEQYAKNARIRPESGEAVEFAIRMPGNRDGEPILLPIDCKFPHEDYERLLLAQEAALPEEVERAGAALERAVRAQAKTISEKYIHPPFSTDFAIMYLPTEGLFAEVIRRPGVVKDIQDKHRVAITGPTTLAALLNSLQMGFRTLAIEKRSSEVWQVLGAAKAEFQKYGEVWDKLGRQLATAQNTVAEAGRRTRAVTRKLRDVEVLDGPAVDLLMLEDEGEEDPI